MENMDSSLFCSVLYYFTATENVFGFLSYNFSDLAADSTKLSNKISGSDSIYSILHKLTVNTCQSR